jgi:hypothetical protein
VSEGAMSRPLGEVMRDEMVMKDRIADALRDSPKTIPEIAEALAAPTEEVTLWVMAMRRYGALEDLPKAKADDYFRYKVVR